MKAFSRDEVIRYYLIFFGLACGITWITAIVRGVADASGSTDWLLDRIIKFGPSLAGIIMVIRLYGTPGLKRLGAQLVSLNTSWKWYLFALAPLPILGITVYLFSPGLEIDPNAELWQLLLLDANTGLLVYFFTRGGMGEELGWRGFAIPLLKQHFSLFQIGYMIGLPWALWHLPAMIGNGILGFLGYTFLVLCLSYLFVYLFEKTKQSLFFVILLHSTVNASDNFWEALLLNEDPSGNWKLPLYALMVVGAIVIAVSFYKKQKHGIAAKATSGTQSR